MTWTRSVVESFRALILDAGAQATAEATADRGGLLVTWLIVVALVIGFTAGLIWLRRRGQR